MVKRLDEKIRRIREGRGGARDFILADAKDADMAFGLAAPGIDRRTGRWKTLADYREQIRAVIKQDIVDLMLLSASNVEQLAIREGMFVDAAMTPAARANDTTDIWAVRGGVYSQHPSRPFRSASLDHIKYGRPAVKDSEPAVGAELGLYSITFTNDLDRDYESLKAFQEFRREASQKRFRYFLEVFNPNVDARMSAGEIPAFVNDQIVRTLAGVTSDERPLFLKIAYNGPAALEELVSYDSSLIVGVLGGGAGTTRDAFQLLHDAQKHGARAALFGRKINLSEHPLGFIALLRRIADGEISPVEAVRAYHAELAKLGIAPLRSLDDDQQLTPAPASAG